MAESERLGASFSIDVTNLKAGLAQANRLIRESQSEFKAASAGLDNWAKSEEGVNAKIKSLNSITAVQREKVNALKTEYQNLIRNGLDPTSREAVELRTKINNEEAALRSNEAELQRQIEALENLGETTEDAGDGFDGVTKAVEKADKGFTVMKGALANLVADGFKKAISAAKEFATSMVTVAAEVKAENSQYEQAFGPLIDAADEAVNRVASSTGILKKRLQNTAAGIYAFARSSGASTAEAMALMENSLMATADSAAYYDRSLEDSAETLQSFLKGNFANDAALGVSATEFTRNAKASELFGKKYNELTEIQKQQTLLKMVTDAQKLSGAMGQAARESDGFENVMGNVNETWRQFKAKVGTPVLEQLIPVVQEATAKFQKFADSVDWNAFGKKVTTTLKNIIKEGKTIGKNVLPTVKTALKVAGSAAKFVIENFETLVTTVGTAIVVFKAFKAAMAVTTAITAAKTAVAGLSAGVGVATKAQTIWNAAMSANPIGAVITAVALLTAGIAMLAASQAKAKEGQDLLSESQRQAVTAAQETAQSYAETKQAAEEMAQAEIANIDYTKTLWSELQTLADANGKVKEGYEGRAQFILGQLNEALGTEYKMNGNVIQSYKDIKKSIEDVMLSKKAQILLQAHEENYKQAIEAVSEAEKARATQAQELAKQQEIAGKAEAEYAKAQKKYAEDTANAKTESDYRKLASQATYINGLKEKFDEEQAKLDEVQTAYDETNSTLEGYYADISDYEQASSLIIKGETEKAVSYLNNLGSGFQTAASTAKMSAEEQKKTLEQQVIDTEVNAELMEKAYKDGVKGVTEEMVITAREQAEQAKEEFHKVGGNITKGIAEGAEGEEKTKWTLSGAMSRLIKNAVSAAQDAMDAHSPSRLFKKEVGRYIGQGVAVGIDDSTKDAVKSVKRQVRAIEEAYDLSGVSNDVSVGAVKSAPNGPQKQQAGGVTVYQTNNYSQAHSRLELYKSKQQTAAAVRLAMAGV